MYEHSDFRGLLHVDHKDAIDEVANPYYSDTVSVGRIRPKTTKKMFPSPPFLSVSGTAPVTIYNSKQQSSPEMMHTHSCNTLTASKLNRRPATTVSKQDQQEIAVKSKFSDSKFRNARKCLHSKRGNMDRSSRN